MKAPQIILIVIYSISLLLSARDHGKPRPNGNFWLSLVATVISVGLLLWGGFFG